MSIQDQVPPEYRCVANERGFCVDCGREIGNVNLVAPSCLGKPVPPSQELWDADPNCQHNIVEASGGGIKCTKCRGWFCY